MKTRLTLSMLLVGSIPLLSWWHASADNGVKGSLGVTIDAGPAQYIGAGSCAASACHGGSLAKGHTGSEFAIWGALDRHAKAYETLFEERAIFIQKNLHSKTPAHEDRRCLSCHFGPVLDAKPSHFKTDGVSCESCHGPAERWINLHHLDSWQLKSAAQKKQWGMNDTQSLLGRTRLCVQCHVGGPGKDVNHELIAAGHPRLHFEMTAFHAYMPRHWPDGKDRDSKHSPRGRADFESRAWMMGQLVTAQASLELLSDRAGDARNPWPEFAEHDCAACHQALQSALPQTVGRRKPGVLPWGHYVSLTRQAVDNLHADGDPKLRALLDKLQKNMETANPNRKELAADAKAAAALLQPWQTALDRKPFNSTEGDELIKSILQQGAKATSSTDERTQANLALSALIAGQSVPATLQESLWNLRRNLEPPKSHDPEAIRKRLNAFKIR